MSRLRHLSEPYAINGVWWLSSDPDDQITGQLTFDQEDGALLSVVGAFGGVVGGLVGVMSSPYVVAYRTIHGVTIDGKRVTLAKAVQKTVNLSMPGMVTQSFLALWVFIGGHFTGIDDAAFYESHAAVDGLDAWLGHRPFHQERVQQPSGLQVTARPAPFTEIEAIEAIGAEVIIDSTIHVQTNFLSRISFDVENTIGVRTLEPRSADWHFGQVQLLNKFIALCTGRDLNFLAIRLHGASEEVAPGHSAPQVVDVLVRVQGGSKATIKDDDPIYTLQELRRDNPTALSTWFAVNEVLQPAIDLLFSVIGNSGLYSEVAFLLAIQAVEVFHRRTSSDQVMERSGFETLKAALLGAVPAGTPKVMADKLQGVLTYANEPSLGQRLKRTIGSLDAAFGSPAFGFDRGHLRPAVQTRNYYTHYSPDLKDAALRGQALHLLTHRLTTLLFALLLLKLDLPAANIASQFRRRQELSLD